MSEGRATYSAGVTFKVTQIALRPKTFGFWPVVTRPCFV